MLENWKKKTLHKRKSEHVDRLVESQIEVYYFGRFECAPFNKFDVLQSKPRCEAMQIKLAETPNQDQDSEGICNCELCEAHDQYEKTLESFQEHNGISEPKLIGEDRMEFKAT